MPAIAAKPAAPKRRAAAKPAAPKRRAAAKPKHPKRLLTLHLVLHCSATRANQPVTVADIKRWHTTPVKDGGRGWSDIGYHYVIERGGALRIGRQGDDTVGAHVAGFNDRTLGICLVGGLNNRTGAPEDNFTPAQMSALGALVRRLLAKYPNATVLGHRDLSPDRDDDGVVEPSEWLKACPCFDARLWARTNGLRAAP